MLECLEFSLCGNVLEFGRCINFLKFGRFSTVLAAVALSYNLAAEYSCMKLLCSLAANQPALFWLIELAPTHIAASCIPHAADDGRDVEIEAFVLV